MRRCRLRPWLLASLLAAIGPAVGAEGDEAERVDPAEKVLLYRVEGVLDAGAADKLKSRIEDWIAKEPLIRTVLVAIDSPGTQNGRLDPAQGAAEYLRDLKGVRVVAWVGRPGSGQAAVAGNASALLLLAARDIVLSPEARIGFIPDTPDTKVEVPDRDEKEAEAARSLFRKAATWQRGLEGRSYLAAAMVSRFHPRISRVSFDGRGGEEEVRFLTDEDVTNLKDEDRHRKRPGEFPVVAEDRKLTLDHRAAPRHGFGVAVQSDSIHDVLLALKILVADTNIIDDRTGAAIRSSSPAGQSLVDFLTHPVVRFILLLIGTLGLLLEVKMPGTLIPSLVSIGAFALFFISGMFAPTGGSETTTLWEVLLFVLGLGLISVEVLLLPGVLLFGLAGAAACLIAIVLAMVPSTGTSLDYRAALATLIASSCASVLVFAIVAKLLPRSPFFDKSGIVIYSAIQGTPTADSAVEAQAKAALLVGKTGTAVTPLRPAGTAEVDGERIDVVAEGDFVERGEKVRIVEMDGTRTVVKKA